MKKSLIGIGIAIIVIGVFLLALTNPNLQKNKETWFGFINVNPDQSIPIQEQNCSGTARCFEGIVSSIIDGDTIKVNEHSIRFALASAPELDETGGIESRTFIEYICPVGSHALVDEDDGQTQGSYGRIIGVVYCNETINLNEKLLDAEHGYLDTRFCSNSEFAGDSWAQKHGC